MTRIAARGLGCVVAIAGSAAADTPLDRPSAIEVDRETSPPGRPELGFDGGAPIAGGDGPFAWAASVSLGWLDRPLVLRSGDVELHPVERRATLGLGAAFALGASVVVDARMPLAWQRGDRLRLPGGDPRALDRWVPGDLRLGGRIRVVDLARGAAFVRGELSLPTGDDGDLAGEAAWSFAWSLIGRFALPQGAVLALAGGIRLRGREVVFADRLVGDELFGGVGLVIPIPPIRPLWYVADQVKLTGEVVGILGDDVAGQSGPSPAEVRLGLVTQPRPDITLGVRIGAGIVDEVGAPTWRATLELSYHGHRPVLPPASHAEAATSDDHDEADLDDP